MIHGSAFKKLIDLIDRISALTIKSTNLEGKPSLLILFEIDDNLNNILLNSNLKEEIAKEISNVIIEEMTKLNITFKQLKKYRNTNAPIINDKNSLIECFKNCKHIVQLFHPIAYIFHPLSLLDLHELEENLTKRINFNYSQYIYDKIMIYIKHETIK